MKTESIAAKYLKLSYKLYKDKSTDVSVSDITDLQQKILKEIYVEISKHVFKNTNKTPKLVERRQVMKPIQEMESPPKFAQYLMYLFADKNTREAILGDLEEEYHEVYLKFGPKKAWFFYWWQVFRSLFPLLLSWIIKLSKLWIKGIVEKSSTSI